MIQPLRRLKRLDFVHEADEIKEIVRILTTMARLLLV